MTKLRNQIVSWCRYWHFNVMGAINDNAGHRNYLDITTLLDDWHDTDCWDGDSANLDEAWSVVLSNIKLCTQEQLLFLVTRCTSRPD